MKEVMESIGRGQGAMPGEFHLLQASVDDGDLFIEASVHFAKRSILKELENGQRQVSLFRNDWVLRPDDLFTSSSYRRCLLELESEHKLEVLAEDGVTPLPTPKRRKYRDEPTLSESLWVRLVAD
ncbi:hypothetical protein PHYC_02900 [Phycisphaerales bacterium]|nr:hypothetical protein PHYC_02900 [Phycisphaerales bacterium]